MIRERGGKCVEHVEGKIHEKFWYGKVMGIEEWKELTI